MENVNDPNDSYQFLVSQANLTFPQMKMFQLTLKMSGGNSKLLVFILVIGTALAASPNGKGESNSKNSAKIQSILLISFFITAFSIFNVVQFKNEACVSSSTTMSQGSRNGTCYTSEECDEKGGKAEGNCASGFGVCCVFLEKECGTTINQNCTYIQ